MARVQMTIFPPPLDLLPNAVAFGGMLGFGHDCAEAMKTKATEMGESQKISSKKFLKDGLKAGGAGALVSKKNRNITHGNKGTSCRFGKVCHS